MYEVRLLKDGVMLDGCIEVPHNKDQPIPSWVDEYIQRAGISSGLSDRGLGTLIEKIIRHTKISRENSDLVCFDWMNDDENYRDGRDICSALNLMYTAAKADLQALYASHGDSSKRSNQIRKGLKNNMPWPLQLQNKFVLRIKDEESK